MRLGLIGGTESGESSRINARPGRTVAQEGVVPTAGAVGGEEYEAEGMVLVNQPGFGTADRLMRFLAVEGDRRGEGDRARSRPPWSRPGSAWVRLNSGWRTRKPNSCPPSWGWGPLGRDPSPAQALRCAAGGPSWRSARSRTRAAPPGPLTTAGTSIGSPRKKDERA